MQYCCSSHRVRKGYICTSPPPLPSVQAAECVRDCGLLTLASPFHFGHKQILSTAPLQQN